MTVKWEHFHVAIPVTDGPPDYPSKLTRMVTKELQLTMGKETFIERIGSSDSAAIFTTKNNEVVVDE